MNCNTTQKRELLTRPPASVNVQSQGATHDEMYGEFMRIWQEERRRREEEKEFMKSWNEELQRKKDEATARYKASYLRAQHFNEIIREREAHQASCKDESCCKPLTGRCHLVGEEQVSEGQKKRKNEDPYAEERPRWKKRWEEKQAEEERLREEGKRELEEYDLWYDEIQDMVAHILKNSVDYFEDSELMGTNGEYDDIANDTDDDSVNTDDNSVNADADSVNTDDDDEGANDDDQDTDDDDDNDDN